MRTGGGVVFLGRGGGSSGLWAEGELKASQEEAATGAACRCLWSCWETDQWLASE